MNDRERTLAILNYQPYDRLPVVHFGYWDETLEKWAARGAHQPRPWQPSGTTTTTWTASSARSLGFDFGWGGVFGPILGLQPAFRTAGGGRASRRRAARAGRGRRDRAGEGRRGLDSRGDRPPAEGSPRVGAACSGRGCAGARSGWRGQRCTRGSGGYASAGEAASGSWRRRRAHRAASGAAASLASSATGSASSA